MKLRRRKGAVLGLVAVCVLVIVVIGIAFFMISKLIGGGREVAHVTDSGVLNVAKQVMTDVTNNFQNDNAPDFLYDGIPPGQPITLYSYNRCVGHALMVALNAQTSGTSAAATDATSVFVPIAVHR